MPGPSRQFRLFVSSTFSDLKAERDALRESVFPRLQELCRAHDATFQAVDLRWGVSREAAEDQNTMRICLGEIDRCRDATLAPNFIALLGERYGWQPLPEDIPGEEYDDIHAYMAEIGDDIGLGFLDQWYAVDANSVPAVCRLLPRDGEFVDYDRWTVEERGLALALRRAVNGLRYSPKQLRRYQASATEQEIAHRDLLDTGDPSGSVFCFVREIKGLPRDRPAAEYLDFDSHGKPDEEARQRQDQLRQRLSAKLGSRVEEYTAAWAVDGMAGDHIEPFCEAVYNRLEKIIRHELAKTDERDLLETEIEVHRAFARERTRFFIGRAAALERISDYLQKPARHPWVVLGGPGSGKSTLIAKALDESGSLPHENPLYRFIGVAPGSANIRMLLQSLCHELKRRHGELANDVPDAYEELVREFARQLGRATKEKPMIVFLDALDQLSAAHDAHALTWLPTPLPEHVHLVVSTLPGDCLDALEQRVPKTHRYSLAGMSKDEGEQLLEFWLEEVGRTLQESQRQSVLAVFAENGLPLYLRLAFEEVRHWRSDAPPIDLATDIPGVIRNLFVRLSAPDQHGSTMVSRAISYLAAGKNGLSWDEVLAALSEDRDVMEPLWENPYFPIGAGEPLPVILWSRLYYDLQPYLTERKAEGVVTLDFYHAQLRRAVEESYLDAGVRSARHRTLAELFGREKRRTLEQDTKWHPTERELSELPYQLACGELWEELNRVLMDFEFLQAKVAVAGSQALIEDFDFVLETDRLNKMTESCGSVAHLTIVRDAIRTASQIANADPAQLASQLNGRLLNSEDSAVQHLMRQVSRWSARPWLRPLNASLFGGALRFTLRGHQGSIRSVAITADGRLCATAGNSHPDQTIQIWDLDTGRNLHVLDDQAEPGGYTPLAFTGDKQHLIFGNGHDLVVYSVATGLEQHRLIKHKATVRALAVARRAPRAVSVDESGILCVWNLEICVLESCLPSDSDAAELLAISADGNRAVALSTSGITVWDLQTNQQLAKLDVELNSFDWWDRRPLAMSEDGLAVYFDHALKCWKYADETIDTLLRQGDSVMDDDAVRSVLAVEPEAGRVLVSPLVDTVRDQYFPPDTHDTLAVWNLANYESIVTLAPQGSNAISFALSEDGQRAVVAHSDHSVRVWNVGESGESGETVLRKHDNPVGHAYLANDGRRAITHDHGNQWQFWDLATGKQIDGDDDDFAELDEEWRTRFEQSTPRPEIEADMQPRGEFSELMPDSRLQWVYAEDAPVAVCFKKPMGKFGEQIDPPDATPDQTRIRMEVWELDDSGKPAVQRYRPSGGSAASPRIRTAPINNVRVSRDGTLAVSAAWGSLRVWDLETGLQRHRLEGHTGPVWSVVLAEEDRKAVSVSEDATVRVWDLATGNLIATFTCESPLHAVEAKMISDNDSDVLTIIAGEDSGRVHILRLEAG